MASLLSNLCNPNSHSIRLFQLKTRSFLLFKYSVREQLNSSTWRTACLTLINTLDWRAASSVLLDQWYGSAGGPPPTNLDKFLFEVLRLLLRTGNSSLYERVIFSSLSEGFQNVIIQCLHVVIVSRADVCCTVFQTTKRVFQSVQLWNGVEQ